MKFARGKESCIQPVNLQLNEHNSGMRAYRISLPQSAEHNCRLCSAGSHPTKVAASPRLLLNLAEPLRAERVALTQFVTSSPVPET